MTTSFREDQRAMLISRYSRYAPIMLLPNKTQPPNAIPIRASGRSIFSIISIT